MAASCSRVKPLVTFSPSVTRGGSPTQSSRESSILMRLRGSESSHAVNLSPRFGSHEKIQKAFKLSNVVFLQIGLKRDQRNQNYGNYLL